MADRDLESSLRLAALFYADGQLDAAERLSTDIVAATPGDIDTLHRVGALALRAGRPEFALALVYPSVEGNPSRPQTQILLGDCFNKLNRLADALECYDRAVTADSQCAEAHCKRGLLLLKQRSYRAALESCLKATVIAPRSAEAWAGLARVFGKLKQHDLAVQSYKRALAIEPSFPFLKGRLLQYMLLACHWKALDPLIEEIEQDLLAGRDAARPFVWQAVSSSPRSLQLCATRFNRHSSTRAAQARQKRPRATGKLRIGYISGEFRDHPASYLTVGVFEHHDKDRFDVIAFDNGWDDGGATRSRINAAMDRVIDIRGTSDAQAAAMIEKEDLDVLIDINGFLGLHRTGALALRPAPVQVTFPGYPGTLGAPYIDYIITDKVVLPETHQPFYDEMPVYLPNSYQANDRLKIISQRPFERRDLGLPETGIVFCCFNNTYKILPDMFDSWTRILKATPDSVLWLLSDDPTAVGNLRKAAASRGVDPKRLVFAERTAAADHLARHRCADLFLDTLPCNAHATASDALWTGLPVLTCLGTAFAGRVAASLLRAIDLPELITETIDAYEAEAIRLATQVGALGKLRKKLARNRLTTPLFDTALFTKHLEMAYVAMDERYRSGLPPAPIVIADPEIG